MKKLSLLLGFLTLQLYSEVYQCSGYGDRVSEAKEEAKKSAVASSSTYIKSVFNKYNSTSSGKELSYTLQTVANGICRIESGRVLREDSEFLFRGTCIVENESIRETEKIFREIEELKNRLESQKVELLNRVQDMENRLIEVSDKSEVKRLKVEISKLNQRIDNLPKLSNIYKNLNYQIVQNSRVLNRKMTIISGNLSSEISSFQRSFNLKTADIDLEIGALGSDIEKLSHRVSLLEELMRYIFYILGGIGLILIFLLFRRSETVTIQKVADIGTADKRVILKTAKKLYRKGEKLLIEFSHKLPSENYIYIIDINSRNETTLLYPAPTDNSLLMPNSLQKLPEIEVVPPYGKDILKIIASPIPLKVPKIVYGTESRVFSDSRGFQNPNIATIETDLAEKSEISDKDIIAHFRGQALSKGFQLSENYIELETRES
jgi:hypothetical protein